ncbi:helix-turn-helix domain-containing protein [Saxibacter everestensis]|uniref:Helix-turn-helix domain-containing protein n=1 Tax=Saxibacter everestensis TaxID=2909229 RepID=A0ABY8QUT9_9MICO|nr:helix-turn-helix domain-containing protein [Brevibacteriaceae bacterium ZFBP1038]
MARPRDQDRRRREIVDAAARTLVERGYAATRLRDIADAAGVTSASVLYYYPELAELYGRTYAVAADEYVARRRERMETETGGRAQLFACIESGVPTIDSSSGRATLLLIELEPLACRHPEIAASHFSFVEAQQELYRLALRTGIDEGSFSLTLDLERTARLILAAEDGLALNVLTGQVSREESIRSLSELAAALVGDPDMGHRQLQGWAESPR